MSQTASRAGCPRPPIAAPRARRRVRRGPPRAARHDVGPRRSTVLICDEDRSHTAALASGLEELGYAVEVTRLHAEAFAIACALDVDAIVAAPFLRDGSALVLPAALGIRRPPVLVLASRMNERLAAPIVAKVGFDAQLVKVVDPRRVDRMVRAAGGGRTLSPRPSRRSESERSGA